MARLARGEVFYPDEVAISHFFNRTTRRCFLMGQDPISGKNFDHRKVWIEHYLRELAASFGIDLLGFAILSNHFHLILRSRPDVVATWDDVSACGDAGQPGGRGTRPIFPRSIQSHPACR